MKLFKNLLRGWMLLSVGLFGYQLWVWHETTQSNIPVASHTEISVPRPSVQRIQTGTLLGFLDQVLKQYPKSSININKQQLKVSHLHAYESQWALFMQELQSKALENKIALEIANCTFVEWNKQIKSDCTLVPRPAPN